MNKPAPRLVLLSCLTASLAAQGYATDFEAFTASPAGTVITGQDGFYVPVAGSLDGLVFNYAGNSLAIPVNPNGGANFYAGVSQLVGTVQTFARAQRVTALPANNIVHVQFDVLCKHIGTVTPVNNIGSFSFQPSTTNVYVNLLARWPTPLTFPTTTWNADYVLGPTATGTQSPLPDPAFQGLAVDVWHGWGVTCDLTAGVYLDFTIRNGVTGITTTYTPPAPLAMPLQGAPLPTEFRLFAGGADNVMAVDNLRITGATYLAYGAGCPGSLGVPSLGAVPGSLPLIGSTFVAALGNLPLGLGVMATGFSNTIGIGLPLPLDLTMFGYPGCNLLADPLVSQFLINPVSTTATWSFTIPSSSSYVGMTIYQQGVSLDTAAPGAAFSNGGRLIIGS